MALLFAGLLSSAAAAAAAATAAAAAAAADAATRAVTPARTILTGCLAIFLEMPVRVLASVRARLNLSLP